MQYLPFQWMTLSFSVSALLSLSIIFWFRHISALGANRNDISAVQASHLNPTARIGGLAIFFALIFVAGLSHSANKWSLFILLSGSALPVFAVGLAEDLGYFVSPRSRLLAAAVSGILFVALTGQWILRTGIPVFDTALHWSPFAIAFSIFLAVGISHAFNLIDGLNGLAGSTALGASVALAIIAHQAGLSEHRDILLTIVAAILGFLVFNFPFGKIFLGDAGAYTIGHLLVCMSVSILFEAPNVTPLAMLLIFFWPIADTLLAITRRLSLKKSIVEPDRLHFHQLVMRAVEIVILGKKKRLITNPIATLCTLPFIFAPMVAGVLFSLDRGNSAIACATFTVIFVTTYKMGIWLVPKLRRTARPK